MKVSMKQILRVVLIGFMTVLWSGIAGSFQTPPSRAASTERYEVASSRAVRPGVTYSLIVDKRGPWRVHVLEIDLRHSELDILSARALDKLFGREATSSIAKRHETSDRTMVAALNADFFDLTTGENENNNVVDGEYVKGTKMTGSPFDTFDNIHSQFGLTIDRRPLLDRFEFDGKVIWKQGVVSDLYGVNNAPKSNSIVLFNHYFRATSPTDTVKMDIQELSMTEIRRNRDTLVAVISSKSTSGGSPIGTGTVVLSGYNLPKPNMMATANIGDTVTVWLGTNPSRGPLKTLVGGWPRIVLNGRNIGASVDSIEGTFPNFSTKRNPRSGVGFSIDSTTVYFMLVDGRQLTSAGMTLTEFGNLMLSQGVYQGMNLDGGGSSTFVLEGKIMNTPSDATGERPVGNCLLLSAPRN
jgi:hypothetical protein